MTSCQYPLESIRLHAITNGNIYTINCKMQLKSAQMEGLSYLKWPRQTVQLPHYVVHSLILILLPLSQATLFPSLFISQLLLFCLQPRPLIPYQPFFFIIIILHPHSIPSQFLSKHCLPSIIYIFFGHTKVPALPYFRSGCPAQPLPVGRDPGGSWDLGGLRRRTLNGPQTPRNFSGL